MMRRTLAPNFLVVGAPKCGTTSLYYYLAQHPEIYLPPQKELHYFSYEMLKANAKGPGDAEILKEICQTWDQYTSYYQQAKSQAAMGDISPSYLYYGVQKKILEKLGLVKIIMILRNPIEKAYSQYMHLVRDQRENLDFYEALQQEKNRRDNGWSDIWRYAESSLYAERVKGFLDCFGADRVHVVFFEDFVRQTREEVKKILLFLKVNPDTVINTNEIFNRTGESRSKLVSNILGSPSALKSIFKAVIPPRLRMRMRLRLMDANTAPKKEMDSRSKNYLQEYFKADILKLESILKRRTGWLNS